MLHFLIVFDRRGGKLVELRRYSKKQAATAIKRRGDLERKHLNDPNIEIVIVSAPSEDSLHQTHGRYFKTVSELAREGQDLLRKR